MRKKTIISALITGGVLCILMLFFLYPFGRKEIVVLAPDEGVTKIKPKDRGGVVVPHADSSVYDSLHSSRLKHSQVRLLPEPESPIEIIRNASSSSPQFLDSIDEILANIEDYEESMQKIEAASDSEYIMPNIINSSGGKIAVGDHDDRMVMVPGTKLKVFKATEDRYKIQNVEVVSDKDSGYKIQLSSANSYEDANAQWKQIQQRHQKILKSANLIIKKVEGKNERIFYLVMAGNYPSLNHAKMVCRQLSFKKQNCIVTK